MINQNYSIDVALTKEQREHLDWYLAYKWGVSDTLPDDHPYKNETPKVTFEIMEDDLDYFLFSNEVCMALNQDAVPIPWSTTLCTQIERGLRFDTIEKADAVLAKHEKNIKEKQNGN